MLVLLDGHDERCRRRDRPPAEEMSADHRRTSPGFLASVCSGLCCPWPQALGGLAQARRLGARRRRRVLQYHPPRRCPVPLGRCPRRQCPDTRTQLGPLTGDRLLVLHRPDPSWALAYSGYPPVLPGDRLRSRLVRSFRQLLGVHSIGLPAGGDGIAGGHGVAGYCGVYVTVPGGRGVRRDNLPGFGCRRSGPRVCGVTEEVTEEGAVVDHG